MSDPNAPYINGNPSTGTMGSIPPAASIENPQREIVNFINDSGLTATDSDLHQLGKSVQSGIVNYGLDAGAVNNIVINPTVAIAGYHLGQRFIIKLSHANTSTVVINVSGIGSVSLVHVDGSEIVSGELFAGQLIEVAYDGAKFELIAGGAPGGCVTLTAPRDFYVNNSTGNDLFDGTSANVSGSNTGPFKTIQQALSTLRKYNLGGWSFNIHVADGTYATASTVVFPMPNGSGAVNLIGNATNPAAVQISSSLGSCWAANAGGNYSINGFSFSAPTPNAPGGDPGNGIWWIATQTYIYNCSFGGCAGAHIYCGPAGGIYVWGGTITITGGAGIAHQAVLNGTLYNNNVAPPALNIANAVSFVEFVSAGNGGQARPIWSSITGAANVSGAKYLAAGNGVIDSGGRGVSYLPGSTAGTTSSGGQYL